MRCWKSIWKSIMPKELPDLDNVPISKVRFSDPTVRDNLHFLVCYELNICSPPPQFICWNLTPRVLVLGGGVFGRCLGHEGSGKCHYKRHFREQDCFLPLCEVTAKRWSLWTRKWALIRHQICWYCDVGLHWIQNSEKEMSVAMSHPVYSVFVIAAPVD